jgi:hypothetical protein
MMPDLKRPRPFKPGLPASALFAIFAASVALAFGQTSGQTEQKNAIVRLQAIQPEAKRTHVLILATFHLRQVAKGFQPDWLDKLTRRLEGYNPKAICIESLSGPRVRELELRKEAGPLYTELLDGFAGAHLGMGKRALEFLETTPEAAMAEVRDRLDKIQSKEPDNIPAGQRADLALWMLAAYDPSSAALQWSYLSESDRNSQTVIPADLAARLDQEADRINEIPALAGRLARKLGLYNLHAVDDFEDLDAYAEIMPQLEKDFAGSALLAAAAKAPIYAEAQKRLEECIQKGDLLPQYLFLNSPEYAAADTEAQWGVFLRTHFASGTDRGRLGLWENRNLKIAAHIRTVAALYPGERILVIYGAAHKPFLDAYLSRMVDLEVDQF